MEEAKKDFERKINKGSGRKIGTLSECWFFTTKPSKRDGYCNYKTDFAKHHGIIYAHQAAYFFFKDQTYKPNRATPIRHLCEGGKVGSHRTCCNPDHLELGTIAQNMADRDANLGAYQSKGENVPTAKFSKEQAEQIQARYLAGEEYAQIATTLNVNRRTIERICIGQTYGLPDCRIILANRKGALDKSILELVSLGKSYKDISKEVSRSQSYISGVVKKSKTIT